MIFLEYFFLKRICSIVWISINFAVIWSKCGAPSARVIMVAPDILAMKKENRAAHERNEKSAHVPVFSNAEYRQEQQARREHKHGKGCGCGDKPIRKSALMYTADGNKMFPSARPWMISH
jgi:hypothetical protein